MTIHPAPLLQARGLTKSYGRVLALSDADFAVQPGETVAVVGDNGAGKSTLIKLLSGALVPDAGSILVNDVPISLRTPHDAQAAGIAVVYQGLALVDTLTVAENVFLDDLPRRHGRADRRRMARETQEILGELAINVPGVRARVAALSGGQRQAVAIARAVRRGGRVMIMDEPTAALGVQESAKVLQLIVQLRQRGLSIVLVSHNMQQVFELADRIVVLRAGRIVGVRDRRATTQTEIVHLIVGAVEAELARERA
jgi:ABC-type sugar transport system ATPase subunit